METTGGRRRGGLGRRDMAERPRGQETFFKGTEIVVLRLLMDGKPPREIACELALKVPTATQYVEDIKRMFGSSQKRYDRVALAIVKAVAAGELDVSYLPRKEVPSSQLPFIRAAYGCALSGIEVESLGGRYVCHLLGVQNLYQALAIGAREVYEDNLLKITKNKE